MNSKELRGLMEAYSEVYAPQEVDEAVKGASPHAMQMRKDAAVERKAGAKDRLSPSKGKGYADQQKQQIAYMDKVTKKNKNVVGLVTKEELDIFDVVLEFLQVEGFAETLEEAEWMMANVIDEEAIGILIGEAQVANRDPDKYEREQNKKYAPVRGEKTPMPPRGDKRREDFEKWYAANVR